MYSDTILASNPRSAIITIAEDDQPPARAQRADARLQARPSLAQRVGGSRGSAGMMVD